MRWFWETAIEPLLEAAQARTVVEVGVQAGVTTRALIAYAERNGAVVHGIDPGPQPPALKLAEAGRFVLHRDLSLDALPRIDGVDAALLDGDHNWYTVINELRVLARAAHDDGRQFPLTFMHDVAWPYGRRDQYCDPARIPDEYRQPYARGGLWPGMEELHDDSGFSVRLNHAVREGTPRNGVLTAVEDFMAESEEEFELTTLPAAHGLGILVSKSRLASDEALRASLDRIRSSEWLSADYARLEHARLTVTAQLITLRHRLREMARTDLRP